MVVAPDRSANAAGIAVAAEWAIPGRRAAAVFLAKTMAYRALRGLTNLVSGPPRLCRPEIGAFPAVLAESRTALWPDARPGERRYQLGKVQNLRRAAAALDGLVIPVGGVFSFWRQIGRASRRRGYVTGRMLQQGCLVPATGGGLCQLSNALYDAALQARCAIVERHAHSRIVPGSAAATGRDATVAWNYVDLRFRAPAPLRIEARLTRDELVVRFHGQTPARAATIAAPDASARMMARAAARSCATCGETHCFRHEAAMPGVGDIARTAWLVDENWPEFQHYVGEARQTADTIGVPIDGARWHMARYRWPLDGHARVGSAPVAALARALAIRRAPAQGAARRMAELKGAERIATRLARLLSADITRVVVAQSLAPYLWRDGHLGGREVEILMTRLPMHELQRRLDTAGEAHPQRTTLIDFRAPPTLVEAEAAALAYASSIVSPHAEVAAQFPERTLLLPWALPTERRRQRTAAARRIAFPGPTIARKGAYAVREAARALGLEIVLLGSELEGADFWSGVVTHRPEPTADWLGGVAAVVQPAIVEDRPRRLLAALAAGVPVIASRACGLAAQPGVALVPPDDAPALIAALKAMLG